MNIKYNLVQGINFIKIPPINIKKIESKEMIPFLLTDNDNGYKINEIFKTVQKEANFCNIKNPSSDCVLYFSSRKDVSRDIYDFRVFPKQEVNYYFHEAKFLHCYVTQLNAEINVDINWEYIKNINDNNGIDKNQLKYECLNIFSGEVIGAGLTTYSSFYSSVNWCRYFNIIINTDKNYDLYVRRKNGIGTQAYENTLVSAAGATSANLCLFFIPSNTASITSLMNSFSLGVKNNDGSLDMTVSMWIEMFGNG